MKTKFKYFKCLFYSVNKLKVMNEQKELDDTMYSNILASFKRIYKYYVWIIFFVPFFLFTILCNIGVTVFCKSGFLWYFSTYMITYIFFILLETYIGTKGMK